MDGKPALHIAAHEDRLKCVERLVESGIDVNGRDDDGCTALFYVESGRMARFLLDKGADVNSRCNDQSSALIYAAKFDQIEVASILLEYNADVNVWDRENFSALHFANTGSMAELLIRNGAYVDGRNVDGYTPLLSAAYFLSLKSLEERLTSSSGLTRHDRIENWLYLKKWRPTIGVVRALLHNGADVNCTASIIVPPSTSIDGRTGRTLEYGGQTALHLVLEIDEYSRTVYKAHVKVVEELLTVLLEFGFKGINYLDYEFGTPLHYAVRYGSNRLVRQLLHEGANLRIKNWNTPSKSQTPLDIAQKFGMEDPIRLYVISLKVAGLPFVKDNLFSAYREIYPDDSDYIDFNSSVAVEIEKKCREEIYKLKSDRSIGKLSFYDMLLTKDPKYLLDRKVVVALNSFNYQKYPLYGYLIEKKFASDKKQTVFQRGLDALHSILRASKFNLPEIPPEPVRLILMQLSEEEQEKLTQSDQRVETYDYYEY